MYQYPNCGFEIRLLSGYRESDGKYGPQVAIEKLAGLHQAIAQTIVSSQSRLTKEEFRFLRKELEKSQKEMGDLLDVSEQNVSLWERGQSAIPVLADFAIRLIASESLGIRGMEMQVGNMLALLTESDAPDTRKEDTYSYDFVDDQWVSLIDARPASRVLNVFLPEWNSVVSDIAADLDLHVGISRGVFQLNTVSEFVWPDLSDGETSQLFDVSSSLKKIASATLQ
jgi:DNA-binding transcriptional regulator YiaG